MTPIPRNRGAYVHDLRHRFSYELRPTALLDALLRGVAIELEEAGLLLPGATSAPRFHPHLTLLRASVADEDAVAAAATALRALGTTVRFDHVGTFGDGRIVHLVPADRAPLDAARDAVLDAMDPRQVDPLAFTRPWTPHVTIAYAVPEAARAAALALVKAGVPIEGRWHQVQSWDLDVRPTECAALCNLAQDSTPR